MSNVGFALRPQPLDRAPRMILRPLFVIGVVEHAGKTPFLYIGVARAVLVRGLTHDDLDGSRVLA